LHQLEHFADQRLALGVLQIEEVAPLQVREARIDQIDAVHVEHEDVGVLGDERSGRIMKQRKRRRAKLLDLSDGVPHRIHHEGPFHAVVVKAAADHVALARGCGHRPHVAALPARQQSAGDRPLIVVPAFRFAGQAQCGIDQPPDDGFAVDVLQVQHVAAFHLRIGMNPHVPLGVQHKDVGRFLAPAAAGDAEVVKRRFALAADQLGRVFHQQDELARLLVLVESFVHMRAPLC